MTGEKRVKGTVLGPLLSSFMVKLCELCVATWRADVRNTSLFSVFPDQCCSSRRLGRWMLDGVFSKMLINVAVRWYLASGTWLDWKIKTFSVRKSPGFRRALQQEPCLGGDAYTEVYVDACTSVRRAGGLTESRWRGDASTRRVWCQSGTEVVGWQRCHPDSFSHFCRLNLWSERSTCSSLLFLPSAVRAWICWLGVSQWSCGICLDLLLVSQDHFLWGKEHD